ncbi:MAG: ParB/RepB/Spo0J family partition protein [Parachlamydiaceae bacterium]|nr:ParB/RepB/Spo0J family partition protein [Parachlamydiaceae bacterium]
MKDDPQDELKEVNLDQIIVNPYQPRREFKTEDLEELAESILSVGIIHPPLVSTPNESGLYELIAGERRFRAAQLANLKTIPVIIRKTNQTLSAHAALIENIQRVDLNPLEVSKALKTLMKDFNLNQDDVALKIGKKRSTIANYLRLLNLPQNLQDSVSKGFISFGHAKAILSLEREEQQLLLHELILRDDMSVRDTEKMAQKIGEKAQKQELIYTTRDFYIEHLERKIREKLGTKVSILAKGKKGRLMIDYYNYDDLHRLLEILGVADE